MNSFWSAPLRIFGQVCFALVSFVVLLILSGLLFIGIGIGLGSRLGGDDGDSGMNTEKPVYLPVAGNPRSKNRLLVLSIEGVILGSPAKDLGSSMNLAGMTYGYVVQDMLKEAIKDDGIKGVLLHLQTPGGTIFGSRAIFDGVQAYRQATGKPVVVYIEGLCASGGVMAMVGADAIYADHGSLIGSIGVIGPSLLYFDKPTATQGGLFGGGIVTQGGIEQTVVAAGRGKDLGNPFRRPTAEEVRNLQAGINQEYAAFVRHVAQHRGLEESVIREQLGAQVFDNQTAQQYRLIDGTLNRDQTLAKLAELAKVGEDYQLVRPKVDRSKFFSQLFALDGGVATQVRVEQRAWQAFCAMAARAPLAYHGEVTALCRWN